MNPPGKLIKCFLCCALLIGVTQSAQAGGGQASPTSQQQTQPKKQTEPAPTRSQPAPPTSPQDVQTEKVEPSSLATAPPATVASEAGSLRPEDVAALLRSMHSAEYRLNDLLSDVKPERWKLSPATLDSFNQTLKTLHASIDGMEGWRGQFSQRPDSLYLGYQSYSAVDAVLPRLYGVVRDVRDHENPSYAAQLNQAGDQLFDLQQKIGGYVSSLLRAQDAQILALDNNLASCQQNLGAEMRGKAPRATPMKNARPIRPERRLTRAKASKAAKKSDTRK